MDSNLYFGGIGWLPVEVLFQRKHDRSYETVSGHVEVRYGNSFCQYALQIDMTADDDNVYLSGTFPTLPLYSSGDCPNTLGSRPEIDHAAYRRINN